MSLLKNVTKPVVDNGVQFNIINGNDAEVLAASRTLLACGAEISWGSRNEDGRKIDLFISLDHPWQTDERIICLCQVKSGPTYGQVIHDGFLLAATAKAAAQRTSHAICIIWVDRTVGKTFWAYIHPETIAGKQFYGKNHTVTPAMRYDLARCQARSVTYIAEGSGIILSKKGRTLKEKRQIAMDRYKHFKTINIKCPNLGFVEFTRIGWKHMFRKARSVNGKISSLMVIPYLDKILATYPTSTYISKCEFSNDAEFTYRSSEYVLSYGKAKVLTDSGKTEFTKIIIRLIEEIRYPNDWAEKGIFSQRLQRKLILLSCYNK